MNKIKGLQKSQMEEDLDFQDLMDSSPEEDAFLSVINGLVAVSRDQMEVALELTKVIIGQSTHTPMKEDEILSTFTRALKTVSVSSPMKEMWEQLKA